jgi:hypothetical protein
MFPLVGRTLEIARIPMLAAVITMGWAADPTVGTWTLDLARSRFVPGPPFQSETRIYEQRPDGIKVTIKIIDADGKPVTVEYPVNYDGRFYPVTGQSPADAISLTRIDDWTAESTLKHGDVEVAKARRVVSRDGKTMTITYQGTNLEGERVDWMLVYVKQQ